MAITAYWTRSFLLLSLFCITSLQAQPVDEDENPFAEISLEGNKALRFNELFFVAQKEKNLGNLREAEEIYKELYTLNTTNATVCFELAQIYLTDESAADAIFYAERAHKLKPENQWFTILLANVYRKFGETEKEVKIFKQLLEANPTEVENHYQLALAYLNNNQPKKALKALDETENLIGLNEDVANQKKQIYLQLGDIEGAVAEIEKLIKAFPNNIDYYGSLAKLYEANGYEEKAIALYEKMLSVDPEDPRPHLDLALYYRRKKQPEKSIYHLKKAMASPNLDIDKKVPVLLSLFELSAQDSTMRATVDEILNSVVEVSKEEPKAYAIYGDWLSKNNQGDLALKAYKKAIKLPGGSRFQIWEQILLIQIQLQKYDSIAVYGPDAVALFPNQPLPYFFTGVAYNVLEKPKEALLYLEDGLGYAMGNAALKEQFYVQLADTYHRLKQHKESDAYFEKALALNPRNATALNNYAYYLSVRKEKLEKALILTEQSNMISPNNPVFLDTWAWVLYQKEQYTLALEKMEKVIALSSQLDAEVLMHYGDILFKLNRKTEAKEQWQKALNAGGDPQELNNRLKKVS